MPTQEPTHEGPLIPKNGAVLTHILPALTVLLILIGAAIYLDLRATAFENTYAVALARETFQQRDVGNVIQQAAFRQTDLLPVYGSSEIVATGTPNRALYFFDKNPTGFMVFDIAREGETSLIMAEDLASVGPELKGRKVVISFTPYMFTAASVTSDAYAGNNSRIHSNGLVFNTALGMEIKRLAAKRMVAFPQSFEKDPILAYALYSLAAESLPADCIYYSLLPLGELNSFVLRLQDHYSTWQAVIKTRVTKARVSPPAGSIDWDAKIAAADAQQQIDTNSNPYGIDNDIWINQPHQWGFELRPAGSQDQVYLDNLKNSSEWVDFNILLEVLHQLGAEPLILSRPVNGAAYAATGISAKVQPLYYDLLQEAVKPYNFPVVDFREHTNDKYFSSDLLSHTSPKGWLFVDQVLDAFYHNRIDSILTGKNGN